MGIREDASLPDEKWKAFYCSGWQTTEVTVQPGPDYSQWEADGKSQTVRYQDLHTTVSSKERAEECVASGYQIAARLTSTPDYGLTSIVIVTHNQLLYTRLCLDSIRMRTDESHEIIVVDNASTDGTVEYLQSHPGVKIIENSENRGYPAAANQGIAAAKGRQVLLINNDVVVTTGWLRRSSRRTVP